MNDAEVEYLGDVYFYTVRFAKLECKRLMIENEKLEIQNEKQKSVIAKLTKQLTNATEKLKYQKEYKEAFGNRRSTSISGFFRNVKDKIMTRFMNDKEIQKHKSLKRKRVQLLEAKMKEIEEAKQLAFEGNPYYSTSPIIKRVTRKLNQQVSAGKVKRDAFRKKLRENDWKTVHDRFRVDEEKSD